MRTLNLIAMTTLAILGTTVSVTGNLYADEGSPTGVIRISDSISPIPEPNPLPGTVSQIKTRQSNGNVQAITSGYVSGSCGVGCGCESCQMERHRRACLLNAMINPWGGCSHSPDHGWGYPQKYPIQRIPVTYRRYWPNRWYGQPGYGPSKNAPRYPTVYMPTDTTQLGYYYQRVPQWRPNPAMLPPIPRPSQWHVRHPGQCGTAIGHPGVILQSAPQQSTPTPNKNVVPPKPAALDKSAARPQGVGTQQQ
ncbi:MAG: hypothetical protein Tsb009_22580 [Planctomycetaceae bacterium]